MLLNNGLTLRYRRFKAYHEHTYPISFFLLGVGNFILQVAAVGALFLCLVMLVAKISNGDKPRLLANSSSDQTIDRQSRVLADTSVADVIPASQILKSVEQNSKAAIENPLQQIVSARAIESSIDDPVRAIYDHEWILARPEQHFVIQLASSPRFEKLLDFSRELGGEELVSIFPFKVSSSGDLVYGISTGEFPTLQKAMDAVDGFSKKTTRYSPWIRKVSDLQKDINSVSSGEKSTQQQ